MIKHVLFLIFTITSLSVSAQLTVTNNSFIFVDGDGFTEGLNVAPLFVTNTIDLVGANSNIYLRNGAQLLQGTGTVTSLNSGTGHLSVYQTGTVNQWAYNYWCSPVGNNSVATGNENARVALLNDATGLITFTPAAFTAGFNGSASPLTISTRWLWTYQISSLYADWAYVGDTGPIAPGLGFTMKGNGTGATGSQVYDFRGKPNNGTISNPVADNDNTLIGNPYPSAMDSAAFIHDTQNAAAIDGTLFYWEQDASIPLTQSHTLQDYVGGYSEFTIDASGLILSNTPATFFKYDEQDNVLPLPPGPPRTGSKMAQRYIPIGQGFMVQGSVGSSGIVRAKNAHRVYQKQGAQSYFFRGNNSEIANDDSTATDNSEIQFQENGLPYVPEDYKRFRVNIEFTISEAKYIRQLLLNFHDTATAGFDYGLELTRSNKLANDAYFTLADKAFSGQAFPFEETLTIPLIVDIEIQQPLRFRVFDIQNFDETQGIYIHDIENDTYVNLRNSHYDLNIAPGNYTDRFEIVFASQSLGIDDIDASTLTINQINNANHLVVLNPNSIDIKSIEVYDISGRRLLQSQYNAIINRYELSTINISDGTYVVNVLSDSNKTIKSQKIIIKN